jgi:CHAD domain-containing protein
MAYKLNPREAVSAGVKRIARDELGEAIEALRAERGNGAVHEVRKHLKKVRALLRLVKRDLGAAFRQENARLREIGRALSPLRDAEALIEAVDRVKTRRPELGALRRELVRHRQVVEKGVRMDELTPKLVRELETAKRGVRSWTLNGSGVKALEPGIKGSFRKGRKALARYRKTGTREDLHEWRKRVKDHWYHVRLLEGVSGDGIKKYERSLKELEDALGEHLNLALLDERDAGREPEAAHAIEEEQRELQERAMEIGDRVYAEKARRVVKRLIE